VAQHDDLKLPLTASADKHANETAQEPIEQRHQHDAQSEPAQPRSPGDPSLAESTFFTPHVEPLVSSGDALDRAVPALTPAAGPAVPAQVPQALRRGRARRVPQDDPLFPRQDLCDLPDRNDEEKPAEPAARTAIRSGRSSRDAYRTSSTKPTRPCGESTRKPSQRRSQWSTLEAAPPGRWEPAAIAHPSASMPSFAQSRSRSAKSGLPSRKRRLLAVATDTLSQTRRGRPRWSASSWN
jgi:hypothetical protein